MGRVSRAAVTYDDPSKLPPALRSIYETQLDIARRAEAITRDFAEALTEPHAVVAASRARLSPSSSSSRSPSPNSTAARWWGMAEQVGARGARVDPLAPPQGLPGCRAPAGGVFTFEVDAFPPSKSNQAVIITRPTGHAGITKSQAVRDFEDLAARAICRALREQAGIEGFEWFYRRAGEPYPHCLNPIFGHDREVDVRIHLYEPYRTNRDVDNPLKLLLDVLRPLGVLVDDVQIGNLCVYRREHVGSYPTDKTIVYLHNVHGPASWMRNHHQRPVSTHVARRWAARDL